MALILKNWMIGSTDVDEELQLMRSKNEALCARAADVNTQLEAEEMQPGRKRKRQVENWLKNVEELEAEVGYVEKDVKRGQFSSHKMLKRDIVSLTQEMDDLMEQGNFPGGLTLDDHASSSVPLVTSKLKGRLFEENLRMILSWLVDEDVCRIGVYGLGGIGKTTLAMHIHNKLHEDVKTSSVHVYWVTVSQENTIVTLQRKIAKAAKVDHLLEGETDQIKRAAVLSNALKKRKKVVLFLDDMWKHFEVEKVGVPVGKDECKLIITSRSLDVCRRMLCQRRVKIETLSKKESWELFLEKLNNFDDLSLEVRDVAKLVAKKCAGLPLGILTIAGSMRGVTDIHEWKDTLEELNDPTRHHGDMETDVFPLLELSYNRLNDVKLQKCFLGCAFFPEDSKLSRYEIINFWVSDSLLENIESREKQLDKGHTILNRLINASLLESLDSQGNYVKMHDLIRDMAIKIGNNTSRFLIRSGLQLTRVPNAIEWTEDLVKVSLISNHIADIPSNISPACPYLSTLLLTDNPLKTIPDSFFLHMMGLRFLSLTQAPIKKLPDSISELKNLSALEVAGCMSLNYVPPLSKLVKLRVLNLNCNGSLVDVPKGIEVLPNLRFLGLQSCDKLCVPFHRLLTGLSYIEHLEIGYGIKSVLGTDLMKLQHLRRLKGCWMSDVSNFNSYFKSQHFHQLKYYQIYIAMIGSTHYYSFIDNVFDKNVVVYEYGKDQEGQIKPIALPDNIQFLQLICVDSSNLLDVIPSMHGLSRLSRIWIGYCDSLEHVWSSASCSDLELESLEELNLTELVNFRGITVDGKLLSGALRNLKKLTIEYCWNIEALFTQSVLNQLQNLEVLEVQVCSVLRELVSLSDNLEDAETADNNDNTKMIYLPKLRILQLIYLPNLVTICLKGLLSYDHIENITIIMCPLVKKLPLSFPLLDDGQPAAAPLSLKMIMVEKEWWEKLEWDNPDSAYLLQPLVTFSGSR
ncbi:probable disease resistance protein At4g27220 [Chenopodium quinoa]|uniref:probable disease resistance protein At4g27220 n=1 Tax=Chenopodium quinoa TaxID=63459 RepID=UPI000B77320F|nr:probable disease resistance protein At4g27220 [Chenopodium quinoa]